MTDSKTSPQPFLGYGRQTIHKDDLEAVTKALSGDWLTQGPLVGEFETNLAKTCHAPHVIACMNGTAALHLAYLGCGLKSGDSLLTSPLTFLATANAARFCGAEVQFADVDLETGCLCPEAVEASLGLDQEKKIKTIAAVHLAGNAADMKGLSEVAASREIQLVEDACHGLGGLHPDGNPIGSLGYSDSTVFSFHPVKPITTAEGGAITVKDDETAERLRRLVSHGVSRDGFKISEEAVDGQGHENPWYYEMQELGFNYRLPDLNAALGISQLKRLDTLQKRREALAHSYDEIIQERLSGKVRPLGRNAHGRHAWHIYVVRVDFEALGTTRAMVMQELRERGIGCQVHYIPLHLQPYYRAHGGWQRGSFPNAEALYDQMLTLPLFPNMADTDPERVVEALADILS